MEVMMDAGLMRITHYDIMLDMLHDGYYFDDPTTDMIQACSEPSVPLDKL